MNTEDKLLVKWANNDLTSSERDELSNHYNTQDLDQFIRDSDNLELETNNASIEWERLAPRLKEDGVTWRLKYLLFIIPLLLLMIGGSWYVNSQGPDKVIQNTTSEPILIAMEDNTEIMLAPGSNLSYYASKFAKERKVWLEGRAFFDVRVKGDFSVVTDNSKVSVLGTTFDIWELAGDEIVVQCFTGKVSVSRSDGQGADLATGQKYSNTLGKEPVMGIVEQGSKPKWLSNNIVFEGVELYKVYKDLEKYYPIKFVGELGNFSFNGELPTDNLEKVIDILNVIASDTYKIEKDKVVVSKSE